MQETPETEKRRKMPFLALLGLSDPDGMNWNRIRAMQLRGAQRHGLLQLFASVLGAILVVNFSYEWNKPITAGAWFVAVTVSYLYSFFKLRKGNIEGRKSVSRPEILFVHLIAVVQGLLWGSAFLFLGASGDVNNLQILWSVVLCLVVGTAMLMSIMPMGSVAFIAITGAAAAFSFAQIDHYGMSISIGVISILLIAACLNASRYFVERRLAESSLREKNEVVSLLLREFEDTGADWLWQTDPARNLVHVSPRFAHALDEEADAVNGKPLLELISGEDWQTGKLPSALRDLAEKLQRKDSFSNILIPVKIGGQSRWWELSASPKLDNDGIFLGFRGVGSDVTEQRESAEKIAQLARYDSLTSLPNRLQLTEALGKAMQEADRWNSRCGFMMIDLDRFKAVNDTLGHPVGDRVLARVSDRLQSLMDDNALCGRLGGDEFAVVLKDASDPNRTRDLANAIIATLSRPYEVDQHTIYIGASVGSALGPRDGRTVEMLMRSADLALYRSKNDGGGKHHCYEPQLHVHAEERRVMEIALRNALENNEMSLNYQPVVDAEHGSVVGFEALLRWTNPEFGPVSPAKFVPLAEEARLIVPIGEWVLRTACREALNWPSSIKVAVNVSADQLTDGDFVNTVVSALQDSGLPPYRLEIEVTESLFMQDGPGVTEVLDRILGMGIHLSLDDFGTGYSSLGYLRKTRFSTIKVDRSFVKGAANKAPESLAIIRAVVAMADSLGMSTTAEGAETEAEVEMIRRLGCRKIQGYYYGRPMLPADARQLFRGPGLNEENIPKLGEAG